MTDVNTEAGQGSGSVSTAATDAVDELVSADVLEPGATAFAPSESFRAAVAERTAAMDEGRVDPPAGLAAESRASGVDRTLLATYAVLRDRLPDLSEVQALVTSVLLDSAESRSAPASGAPEGFLPVHGADAIRIVDNCARCVVYVWRDDCPPCETIRSNLGVVFGNDPPDGVLPLSVYGPDAAGRLREEYDVFGGPTTLFTLDGRVDARFVGVADVDAIEREVEILRDRSGR